MPRISASRSNAKARLRTVLICGCVAALVGWLVYDQTRDGSADRRETTADARPGALDARGLAAAGVPPMPYRFAGTSSQGGATQYLLARGERVFAVQVGEILDSLYRVESTSEHEIALRYLPLGLRQIIPLYAASWPPAGESAASSAQAVKPSPLPPAVQRTRSPALLDLSR